MQPKCSTTTHPLPMPPSENNKELLTIVIPVYNREHLITKCLDSIAARTLHPIHIIVVDNNSTDSTVKVVQEWSAANKDSENIKLTLLSEKRQGAAAARNRGLDDVSTPWVMFFDSDDIMKPGHVESVVQAIRNHPDADILYWPVRIHITDGSVRISRDPGSNPLENQLIHCSFATQNYAVRTDLIRKTGGWDATLRAWDDWELGVRLLLQNPVIQRVVTPGVDVMRQADSITGIDFSSKRGRWEEAIDRIEVAIKTSSLPPEEKALAFKACIYRRIILAADYLKEGNREAARSLEESVDEKVGKNFYRRLLRLAESYTAAGGRGAWRIMRLLRLVRN